MAALFFPLLSVLSQAVFGAHITKVLIPSIVFLTRTMLRRICQASNRLLDTSSDLLLWDGDSEFPLPPVLSPGATRDVYRTNDATRGWKKRARRKEKKEKHFHTNTGISALKQWWRLFLDISVIAAWKCVQMADFTPFSLHFCAFGVISYLYQVHTHTQKHTHSEERR